MDCAFNLDKSQAPAIVDTLSRGGSRKNLAAMAVAAAKAAGSDRFISLKTIDPETGVAPRISAHKLAFVAIESVREHLPTGECLASIDYSWVCPNSIADAVRVRIDGPRTAAVWDAGDKSRFGLVAVDPATFRRSPRESAHVLGAVARRGRL